MILITGANGFVGHRLMETVTDAIAAPSLRNATQEDIKRFIEESGADTIIHTADISDIGVCQSDPEASYLANVRLPLWIAQASAGRKLICFSSDQVYSGNKEGGPYTEEMVAPGNVYAAHKLEMEQRVLDCLPKLEKVGKVSDIDIKDAEIQLRLNFANEYRDYLAEFGSISSKDMELTGIISVEYCNVVSVTKQEWGLNPQIPHTLYVIENTCVDGIIIWQDTAGIVYKTTPDTAPTKIASSLYEYITNRIK